MSINIRKEFTYLLFNISSIMDINKIAKPIFIGFFNLENSSFSKYTFLIDIIEKYNYIMGNKDYIKIFHFGTKELSSSKSIYKINIEGTSISYYEISNISKFKIIFVPIESKDESYKYIDLPKEYDKNKSQIFNNLIGINFFCVLPNNLDLFQKEEKNYTKNKYLKHNRIIDCIKIFVEKVSNAQIKPYQIKNLQPFNE